MRYLCVLLLMAGCVPDRVPDLQSSDPFARMLAILDLGHPPADDAALQTIVTALDDPHELVREAALISLSDIGDRAHIDAVAALLGDPSAHVRRRACQTLAEMNAAAHLDGLVRLMKSDADPLVRLSATYAVGAFAAEPSARAALSEGVKDADPAIRHVCSTFVPSGGAVGESP